MSIGQRILLDTKPGESLHERAILPIFSEALITAELVSVLVLLPLMTSTNFMIGTGFMKCIPMTLSGRFVASAMVLMEIEDVLEARMVSGLQIESSSAKMDVFKSAISGTASTTRSQSAQSARSVEREIRAMVASASSCFRAPSAAPSARPSTM